MKKYAAVLTVAASLCVLLPQPAAAQTLYKSTMPDGRIVYGDKPAPGAAKVEVTESDTSKTGLGVTTPREQEAMRNSERASLQRQTRDDRVAAAEQALKNATVAREAGEEPLEGERIGIVSPAGARRTRLTEAYFERQRKLEEAVDLARRELAQAKAEK